MLKASTIVARHSLLKTVFIICSREGVVASDLSRFPRVIEAIAKKVARSEGSKFLSHLHEIWTCREELGFFILDDAGLRLLADWLPRNHQATQTAYIPPRIWTYQVLRLRDCIDDSLSHREAIEACYKFCLDAHAYNAGGYDRLFEWVPQNHKPFEPTIPPGVSSTGRQHYGRFKLTADRFGIGDVLHKWVGLSDRSGIKIFSKYLSLVSQVGLAYILNFSLMRISEGMGLHAGSFEIKGDSVGDDVCLLSEVPTVTGATSKTIQDDNARWIVSPSCSAAIEAMSAVAFLRLVAARHDPSVRLSAKDMERPLLASRPYEPWVPDGNAVEGVRKKERSYVEMIQTFPLLFDMDINAESINRSTSLLV